MAASSSTSTVDRPSQRTAPRRSRAVLRDVEPGSTVECAHCDERVKFQAKVRNRQVICNVYIKGVWDRVEHFHADCYSTAGHPHGEIVGPLDQRRSPSPATVARQAQAS